MGVLDFYQHRSYRSTPKYAKFSEDDWRNPEWQRTCAITTGEELAQVIKLTEVQVHHINGAIQKTRPMHITPYFAMLMDPDPLNLRDADGDVMPKIDPIFRQAVPTLAGVFFARGNPDMGEGSRSFGAAYGRYPDRTAMISTNMCEMYCTHCQRQKLISGDMTTPEKDINDAIDFVQANDNIRDILITGGDALSLKAHNQPWKDSELAYILERLLDVRHLQHVRVCTRAPVTNPFLVDDDLIRMLKSYSRSPLNTNNPQISVSTHVNHPHEITREFYGAVYKFQQAGFLVRNQMVAINGVNDDYATMTETLIKLHAIGVQPHYVLQGHEIERLGEFLTPIPQTYENFLFMRGLVPGPAIPKFVVNMEGGGGKVDLTPVGIGSALKTIAEISRELPKDHPMHDIYSPIRYLKPWEIMGGQRAYAELMPMTPGEYHLMMGEMDEFYGPTTGKYKGMNKFMPNVNLVHSIPAGASVEQLYSPENYVKTTNIRVRHLTVKGAEAIHGFNQGVFGAMNNPKDAFRLLKINATLNNGEIIPGEDRKFLVEYLRKVGGIGGITAEKAGKFLVEDREALIKKLISKGKLKGIAKDQSKRYLREDLSLNARQDELRKAWLKFLEENRGNVEPPFEKITITPPKDRVGRRKLRA